MNLKDRCQSIYWNLLELLHQKTADQVDAPVFVRELMETQGCDEFHNMTRLRKAMETKMGKETWSKIKEYDLSIDDVDREKTIQALTHYYYWQKGDLEKALSLSNWLYYHTIFRAERAVVAFGGLSVGYGIYRFVSFRNKRNK